MQSSKVVLARSPYLVIASALWACWLSELYGNASTCYKVIVLKTFAGRTAKLWEIDTKQIFKLKDND
jgi:hypothetical protein